MYLSIETITIIIAAASLAVTIIGGMFGVTAWFLRQMDAQFEKVHARFDKLNERFDQADAKVNEPFDKVHEQFKKEVNKQVKQMGTDISGLQTELNDVKIAVARLEGHQQRLIFPPH